jgi:hypothetical protein
MADDKLSRFRNLSGTQFDRKRWSQAAAPQRREDSLARARADYDQHKLIPARITQALDLRGLYGPEVDEACDAAEPDVDQWEAGDLYPTWDQVLLLAKLTDFLPKFLLPAHVRRTRVDHPRLPYAVDGAARAPHPDLSSRRRSPLRRRRSKGRCCDHP